MNTRRTQSGFMLIETVASVLVLAVGLPSIAYLFATGLTVDSDVNRSSTAYFLGNSLMNEISARRYWQSSAAPGNTPFPANINGYDRNGFASISDYNIYTTTWGKLTPPRDENGNVLNSYSIYSQHVSVVNIAGPGSNGQSRSLAAAPDGSTDFKLVTVTISWNRGTFVLQKVFARP